MNGDFLRRRSKEMRKTKREVSDDPVMLRIMKALDDCGSTAQDLVIGLSLSRNAFDNWKFGGSKSYMKYLDGIADFTGTTVEYLLRGEERDTNGLSAVEFEIIESFRKLTKKRQECVRIMVHDLEKLTVVEEKTIK
jgi:hypothetical protein